MTASATDTGRGHGGHEQVESRIAALEDLDDAVALHDGENGRAGRRGVPCGGDTDTLEAVAGAVADKFGANVLLDRCDFDAHVYTGHEQSTEQSLADAFVIALPIGDAVRFQCNVLRCRRQYARSTLLHGQ